VKKSNIRCLVGILAEYVVIDDNHIVYGRHSCASSLKTLDCHSERRVGLLIDFILRSIWKIFRKLKHGIVPGSSPYRVLLPTTMENTPLPAAGQSIGTRWRFTIPFDNFSSHHHCSSDLVA